MKIGIFTDAHYSSKEITCGSRYNSRSLEKIKLAYNFFEKENCDLVISLGDLTDTEDSHEKEIKNLSEIADVINSSPIPTVSLMGNHDAFSFTVEEFYKILNCEKPDSMVIDGKKLLFPDACHFKNGKHYLPGDNDWTDTFYPHTKYLKEQISAPGCDVYIFMHQNLDPGIPDNHRLFNADEINRMFGESGNVKAVYQGHYHPGNQNTLNGIRYITFPAMCENENAFFIEEI